MLKFIPSLYHRKKPEPEQEINKYCGIRDEERDRERE